MKASLKTRKDIIHPSFMWCKRVSSPLHLILSYHLPRQCPVDSIFSFLSVIFSIVWIKHQLASRKARKVYRGFRICVRTRWQLQRSDLVCRFFLIGSLVQSNDSRSFFHITAEISTRVNLLTFYVLLVELKSF